MSPDTAISSGGIASTNDDATRVISTELAPNEQLLWAGKPRGGVLFRGSDWIQIPFSIMFTGFSVFWEWGVSSTAAPLFFRLWGVPFVAVGLYMLVGRFIYDAAMRAQTSYGLTDQRVIIVKRLYARNVTALPVRLLPIMTFASASDGTGTITFGSPQSSWGMFGSRYAPPPPPAFEAIKNADAVYRMIGEVQKNEFQIEGAPG